MTTAELLTLVGALGGLGALGTAVAILLKVGVEKTDVKIGTADKVMIGQDRFIETLEGNNQTLLERVAALEVGVAALKDELGVVTGERDRLRRENSDLRSRVVHLEQQVRALTTREGGRAHTTEVEGGKREAKS